jgi:hypothetical protein
MAAFDFTVHSIFPRAANLRPSDGGFLLSLVSDPVKAHPRSAVVADARFEDWGLRPGDRGRFDGDAIRFASGGVAAPLLSLSRSRNLPASERPSRPETARPSSRGSAGASFSLRAAASAIEALRAERAAAPSLAELFGGAAPPADGFAARFVKNALELDHALSARSVPLFLASARGLAGFGPGLTPAGDDFLCGFMAALRSRAAEDENLESFLDRVGAAALGKGGLTERTNDISAAFLADAVEGRFGAALVVFANAALGCEALRIDGAAGGRNSYCLEKTVADLGALGHSSGTDAAAGFLFAYRKEIGG